MKPLAAHLFLVFAASLALTAPASAAAPKKTLDMKTADAVAGAFASDCGACETAVSGCARLSPRRIDCVLADDVCEDVVSVRVSRKGYLFYALYRCASETPTTPAAQVQANPPGGLDYAPLTPAAFEFAADVFPKHLPYPAYPVRHYRGRTSQKEHIDLWVDRKHEVLGVSGASIDAPCFHGLQFVDLGGRHLTHHGSVLNAKRLSATGGRVAFRFHGRLVNHRRGFVGSFRLLHLTCRKAPISFTAKLAGHPGF